MRMDVPGAPLVVPLKYFNHICGGTTAASRLALCNKLVSGEPVSTPVRVTAGGLVLIGGPAAAVASGGWYDGKTKVSMEDGSVIMGGGTSGGRAVITTSPVGISINRRGGGPTVAK
jgi:hypothetical protein